MPQNRLLIGITGNIGSGKTSFCRILVKHRQEVISADSIAQQQLHKPSVKMKLLSLWGSDLIKDGEINRKILADIVFKDPAQLSRLNCIIHPLVLKEFEQITQANPSRNLFFEVPLLFEAKLCQCFDYIILVHASLDIRIQRVVDRDNLDREQVKARLRSQIADEEKEALVDFIIHNDGSPDHLENQAREILEQIKSLLPKPKVSFRSVAINCQ